MSDALDGHIMVESLLQGSERKEEEVVPAKKGNDW
jgi:hypothetical protein